MPILIEEATPSGFPVVCIGGSAGSLPAYIDILKQIPASPGMAIVIVSHRAAHETGRLLTILAKATQMEVVEVTDGMVLEADRVFVAPPQMEIETDGEILRLIVSATKHIGWPTLISQFLFSVASTCNSRAIAIIVSGMGYDGSPALAAVKKKGGWTLAQSDAYCADMPEAAISTTHVDFVLTAAEIGKYLASVSAHLRPVGRMQNTVQ